MLNRHLADHRFLAGDEYSIADIATWPWYGALAKGKVYDAAEFLAVHEYTHVVRWTEEIAERPAVRRGRRVNRVWGPEAEQMKERYGPQDFDGKL